jgi:excisionase family DNA binding protein
MGHRMENSAKQPPYRVREAAREMGVSDDVVRKAIRDGRLGAFRVGREYRIPRERIDKMVRGEAAGAA